MLNFTDPALNLALALLPYPLNDADKARALALRPLVQDWEKFLFWAWRHTIVGAIYANLKFLPADFLPAEVFQSLKQSARQASLRNMQLIGTITKIDRLFRANQIDYYFLKGPLLSEFIHKTYNLRASSDVDLFVTPENFARADALLRRENYQRYEPSIELSPLQDRVFRRYHHHFCYYAPQNHVSIELHWALTDPHYIGPKTSQAWFARGIEISTPEIKTKTLSREDYLAYAFAHGAMHNWEHAKYFLDILAILRNPAGLDWEQIRAALREENLERMAGLGLRLMNQLWDEPVPEPLKGLTETSAVIRFLESYCLRALEEPVADESISPRRHLFWILLKPGWRFRLFHLSTILVSTRDWNLVPLPDFLFPLYFFIRPLAWLQNKWAKRAH